MRRATLDQSLDIQDWLWSLPADTGTPLWLRFVRIRDELPDGNGDLFVRQVHEHCRNSRFQRLGERMDQILSEWEALA